jgi:hypothetical protein
MVQVNTETSVDRHRARDRTPQPQRAPGRLVDDARGRQATPGLKAAHRIRGTAAEYAGSISAAESVSFERPLRIRNELAL